MRILLALVLLPGCYLGTRMGPAYHQTPDGTSRAGFEWDVTAGIEMQIDKPAKINPLEGDTRVALGGGALASSGKLDRGMGTDTQFASSGGGEPMTGATTPESFGVVAGFGTIEAAHTISKHVYDRDGSGMATEGALVRLTGAVGTGGGTATIFDQDERALRWTDASMTFASAGIEGGWHAQSKQSSIGILFGAGVRYTSFDAPGMVTGGTMTPYVSVQIEGISLFQAVMIMARASGGGGCR